jgi:hypothetical protein
MRDIIHRSGGLRGVVRGLLEGLVLVAVLCSGYFVLIMLAAVIAG